MGSPIGELCYLAKQNGRSGGQYHTGKVITVREVVEALEKGAKPDRHPAIKKGARTLLEKMARQTWKIVAAPHKGGTGGKGRQPDKVTHVTVQLNGNYHLRMDKRGHLFEITGPGINTIKPWIAPGS